MKLVITGIQGSGKSTQGNLLSKQLNIPYLSTGHIFRQIAKEKTKLGRSIKALLNAGFLVPDDKTIEIVNNYLSRPEYKRGYILDGFPRTLQQAKQFKNNIDKVIYLQIPEKEALWRLSHRREDRDDETLKPLRQRIELFHQFTEPVLAYYKQQRKIVTIDGTKSIEEVNQEILKSLGKQVVKNHITEWKRKDKAIIAITGLPGSGKTEAAKFFAAKDIPIIYFGKAIIEEIKKRGLADTEQNRKTVREELRQKHNNQVVAILNIDKIEDALKKNMIAVVDGLRSWEEYLYLKKTLPNVKTYILCLYTDKNIRFKRLKQRKGPNLATEQIDLDQLIGLNMAPTLAYPDFLIKNNFSLEELYDKLEQVFRIVYFS